jgi:adenine deaminase
MFAMLDWPECVGMSDTFGSKIVEKDPALLALVEAAEARGKKICGHGSELRGKVLNAWLSFVGNTDDHEAVDADEALEKARLGVTVVLREGSGCPNVADLCPALVEHPIDTRRFAFDADLISPMQLIRDGHIDNNIRIAIRSGVNPIKAVQIATLNAAECLKVSDEIGSIGPGKIADILLVDDLPSFNVITVIADGRIVAHDGQLVSDLPRPMYPDFVRNTVRVHQVLPSDLAISAPSTASNVVARVIGARGDSLITEERHLRLQTRDGRIEGDVERDILKIVSIERHRRSGQIGKGFVQGFGLTAGAIATTYNPHHQNLVVVGTTDEDMACAANEVARVGGGFVVVRNGEVLARLELPLFGLLADEPLADVVRKIEHLNAAVKGLGSALPAPFHTLAFVGLPVIIGKLKISPSGLVDVWKESVVDIVVH